MKCPSSVLPLRNDQAEDSCHSMTDCKMEQLHDDAERGDRQALLAAPDSDGEWQLDEEAAKESSSSTTWRQRYSLMRSGAALLAFIAVIALACYPKAHSESPGISEGGVQKKFRGQVTRMVTDKVRTTPIFFSATATPYNQAKVSNSGVFNLSLVSWNNLAGMGPNTSDYPVLKFDTIMQLDDGSYVDLVVSSIYAFDSKYWPKKSEKNGGGFDDNGQINLRGGIEPKFRFRFVRSGTIELVNIDKFYLTMYDIDNGGPQSPLKEELCAGMYQYAYMVDDANLTVHRRTADSPPCVSSLVHDEGENNPPPVGMEQARISVTMKYMYVSEFDIMYGTPGGASTVGRNAYFGSHPDPFVPCLAETEPANITLPSVNHCNLGGGGPDGAPANLRYPNVYTQSGTSLDMVVTSSNYEGDGTLSGVLGYFGRINQKAGTSVDYTFKFVETGTDNAVVVRNLMFSFFDFDQPQDDTAGVREQITIGPFDQAYVSNSSTIQYEDNGDHTYTFKSTLSDPTNTLPVHPVFLTEAEQKQALTIDYGSVSEFSITVDLTGSGSDSQPNRDIIFSGLSTLNRAQEGWIKCPVGYTDLSAQR